MKHLVGSVVLIAAVVAAVGCPNPTTTVAVTGVTLNATDWTVLNSATSYPYTEQLVATVLPANATNKQVTWKSSNTSLATVSSSGLVTWVGSGSASFTVTATTVDGGFTATCSGTASCPIVYVGDGTGKFTYLTDLCRDPSSGCLLGPPWSPRPIFSPTIT